MQQIAKFFEWFLFRAPSSQLTFTKNTLYLVEDGFGIITNIKYFLKPWYGDNSIVGRVLSIIIRSVTIITGLAALTLASIIFIMFTAIWLLHIPFIIFYPPTITITLLALLYYTAITRKKPEVLYPHSTKPSTIIKSMHLSAKEFYYSYPSKIFFNEILSNSKLSRFLIKSTIPSQLIIDIAQNNFYTSKENILAQIHELAVKHNLRSIRIPHVFLAFLFEGREIFNDTLEKHNISYKQLSHYIDWEEFEYLLANPPRPFDPDFISHTGGGTNRARLGVITPLLDQVSTDYTSLIGANRNRARIIRPKLVEQIEAIMEKSENNNVILRGEQGTGKDSLVWQIAYLIQLGGLKGKLWSKRLVELNISSIVGDTTSDTYEQTLQKVLYEIQRSGNIILYLNDIQLALQSTTQKGNILSILQESISKGACSLIISCTPKEYSLLQENHPKTISISETIDVNETNMDETIQIIHVKAIELEEKYPVIIHYPIYSIIYTYATNYVHNAVFPQKALSLLEDTVIESTRMSKQYTKTPWGPRILINEPQIAYTLTEKTHIPIGSIQKNEAEVLLHLSDVMKKSIVGQTSAIEAVVKVLQRNRAGVRAITKPIGSFLFAGPTGVGKTHVAKMLTKNYFGDENTMIRLDMSEYQSNTSIDRLLTNEPGFLIHHVRSTPFALILLDEIEKAHPKILDTFLQVLDEGRLTDLEGSLCDFSQTIIIATSNAGNTQLCKIQRDYQFFQNATKILQQYFRTEFLNRFDDIIIFTPLSEDEVQDIVKLKLENLSNKLYQEKKIKISFKPETIKWLATFGFSPELGARNLTRLIQDTIETRLAEKILSNQLNTGDSITF